MPRDDPKPDRRIAALLPPSSASDPQQAPRSMLLIGLLALVLRLMAVAGFHDIAPLTSDRTGRYEPQALSLLAGEGFSINGNPVATAPPVYPLVLAGLFSLTGRSLIASQVLLAVVDSATCLLLMLVALQLLGPRIALLAGLALACCPYYMYQVLMAGNDTFYFFVHAAFLLVWLRARCSKTLGVWAVVGGLLGLCVLTRPVALFLPLPLAIVLWSDHRRSVRRLLQRSLLFLAGLALVLAPWTARNWIRFHRFIPSQSIGFQLSQSTLSAQARFEARQRRSESANTAAQNKRDAGNMKAAITRMRANPKAQVKRMIGRLATAWYLTHSGRAMLALGVANSILLCLGVVGMWRTRQLFSALLPAYLVPLYYWTIHTTFISIFRYQLPAVPFWIFFACVPVLSILGGVSRLVGRETPALADHGT